jgi:hypothetical protein
LGSYYLSIGAFSTLLGISDRKARRALARCLEGKPYRGWQLSVQFAHGRGGTRGFQYQVAVESLPPELRQRVIELGYVKSEAVTGDVVVPTSGLPAPVAPDPLDTSSADWQRRLNLIGPALRHPPRSKARRRAIEAAAKVAGISPAALYSWIAAYDHDGCAGLKRKAPGTRGQSRTIISRRWDRAVPFDEPTRRKIAEKLRRYIRSGWANDFRGWRNIAHAAAGKLIRLTIEAGFSAPNIRELCAVPRHLIDAQRHYSQLATRDKDAKAFFDRQLPRTRRTRAGLAPMDIVTGDVHPVDIYYQREDGSRATPKMIGWTDVATNRVYADFVFLPPGAGVRQEHVIESFIGMTQHPDWGLPRMLYLDNGSEYRWDEFIQDAMRLAHLDGPAARRSMSIRAEPHNAASKTVEGIFGILEQTVFALIAGWIGGDRMRSKVANVGKAPVPFPGTPEQLTIKLSKAIEFYHAKPQCGMLGGRSPTEAFAAFVEAGWRRVDIDPFALRAAFAREEQRTVRQGEIIIGRTYYRHPNLLAIETGTKVRARIPKVGDADRPAIFSDAGAFIGIAERSPTYGFTDPEGARDKARRRKEQTKMLSTMRRDVDRLDPLAELGQAMPVTPQPVAKSGGVVRLSEQHEAAGAARRKLGTRPTREVLAPADETESDYYELLLEAKRQRGAK